jgi:hypothetical protein
MQRGMIFLCLILTLLSVPCFTQSEETTPEPTVSPTPAPGVSPAPETQPTPEPYTEDEFPQWSKDLRRAEVILIGSIPFTMFLAIEIFDIYRYVAVDFDSAYAPWPFKSQLRAPYDNEDKLKILITAVSISACIAIIDYIIVRAQRGKKTNIRQKK